MNGTNMAGWIAFDRLKYIYILFGQQSINYFFSRYFVFDMDIGPTQLKSLEKELKIDTDLIRPRLVKQKPEKKLDQVLHCWTSYRKPQS